MVKEIIKRARDPVKSRTINTDVVEKYKKKLAKLEEDIKRVLEEETAEREIAKLENRAGKMQNRINGQEDDRVWFQTKQQRNEEKRKLKEKLKDPTNTKRKMRKQIAMPKDPEEAKAFKEGQREYDFVNREAKRKRKLSKITVFNEDDDVGVINEYQPTNEDHIKIRSSSQSHYAVVDHYIEKKITSKTE